MGAISFAQEGVPKWQHRSWLSEKIKDQMSMSCGSFDENNVEVSLLKAELFLIKIDKKASNVSSLFLYPLLL